MFTIEYFLTEINLDDCIVKCYHFRYIYREFGTYFYNLTF